MKANPGSAIFEWIAAFYNPAAATPPSATCPPASSRTFTPPRSPRHDRPIRRGLTTGSCSDTQGTRVSTLIFDPSHECLGVSLSRCSNGNAA